ncbi:phage tail fiber domain-containing protein [Klebsiella aerogenes]|uniref:phage tail fiber domain-containing protein n=1 Tax=Klebsiella aerogenes TaxID=548 RepID=UPI001918C04D|nr:phage tail fiber protein [Klebsiella aerogenes]
MSVPNQTPYNIYTANGLTTVFTYEFYIISASDLQVSVNGNIVTGGYTVAGVGNKDGGDITFLTPPANGAVVMLERVVPTFRLTDYQDNGDLLADTVNKDFDRIWMAIQRAFIDLGFALTRPLSGGPFDAKGYRIANLAPPIDAQDAATKGFVESHTSNQLRRVLRVPESYVDEVYPVSGRRNSLFGWNNIGRPVPIFSMTDTADLALKLAANEDGLGADLIGLPQGGTVGDAINTVRPEAHGAAADGITDDTLSFTLAAATGKHLYLTPGATYLIASPSVLPFIAGYKAGERRNIYGNGATIVTTGPYEPFHQYADETNISTRVIKYGWNIFDINFKGYANKNSVWAIVNKSIGWTYAYGRAERIKGIGLNAVARGYGHTLTRDCYGDDLRNNVLSLYNDPIDGRGFNIAFNISAGWCTGDVVIIKCRNFYVDGVTYEYAGCVTAENADEIAKVAAGSGEPRGVPVSLGADTTPGGDGVILNVSGNYFGAGAFSLNGDRVKVGGVLDVGSHWTGNFNASLSGAAVWLNVKDSSIGFINAKDVYSGIGFNAGCENFRVDGMSVRSKMAIAGSVLCSATDSSSSAITRGSVGPIYLHGESSINNDVYLNTAGIVFEGIYIAQMNNQQGGYSVEFARACRVKDLSLVATTSAVTSTWIRFSANARVDSLMAERCFGSVFEVRAGAVPSFGDILLRNKQGDAPPVKVLGDGSASHFWGSLTITGPTSGHPVISGKLTLEGYTGLTWRLATVGVDGIVNYPDKVSHTITS